VAGREPVILNPADAAARGIADGALVLLYNDRGRVLAGAVLSDAVEPGVVVLATGAPWEPADDEHATDQAGNPNVLTADTGSSRLSQGPAPGSCLVEARPWPTGEMEQA
jgi:biotin/methionine sulfoxide reductase